MKPRRTACPSSAISNTAPASRHFDYVNPQAPKGGVFSAQISAIAGNQNFDTFNTLNIFVLRGDGAAGMGLTFDGLMARALDEPDALYGLVARAVRWSARRADLPLPAAPRGALPRRLAADRARRRLLAQCLKEKGHPRIAQTIRLMTSAEAEGDDTVVVTFAPERSRDLPLIIAALPIFSKAYYAQPRFRGVDARAAARLRPLQGRTLRSRAASSSSSA